MQTTAEERKKRRAEKNRLYQKRHYDRYGPRQNKPPSMTVHMPPELAGRLERLHGEYAADVSRSVFVCRALTHYMDCLQSGSACANVTLGEWGAADGLS